MKFENIEKMFKKLFCRHNKIEVAFEVTDWKHEYVVLCPKCETKIQVSTVGYTTKPDKTNWACPKRVYKNKKDAETMLNWCRTQNRKKQPERIYPCGKCNGWHLTSQQHFKENINSKLKEIY